MKKLNKFADERGWLCEIFRDDELNFKPAMSYVSVTKPGVVRGPHEHKEQSDCFVFTGPGNFELYLWDRRDGREGRTLSPTNGEHAVIKAGADNPAGIIVPPGIVHGYKNVSDVDALSVNLPDKLYKGYQKRSDVDEIRWEEDENSPYRIT